MTDANKSDITLVLDQSPSMTAIWNETIEGVNKLVHAQQQQPGEADFTLVKFDERVHEGYSRNLKDVQPLNRETYRPQGMGTALYDAIATAIDSTGRRLKHQPEHLRPSKVIFVIYTDGQENSSKQYTHERVKTMIEHQRLTYAWDFIFLGAELNAYAIGTSLGIQHSLNTTRTFGGTQAAYASTNALLSNKRAAINAWVSQGIGYNADDIKMQADNGAQAQPVPVAQAAK